MEPWRLKSSYGDHLCFHGGIDVVDVLPKKSPEEVAAYVKERIETFAQGGGYILAASHNIQDDTPVENVVAMYTAGLKYGNYPLGKSIV